MGDNRCQDINGGDEHATSAARWIDEVEGEDSIKCILSCAFVQFVEVVDTSGPAPLLGASILNEFNQ